MSHGIDYGRGVTNRDPRTGIRYGVIPAQDVPAWHDANELVYGKPMCPECGGKVYPARKKKDFHCPSCHRYWLAEDCYPEDPLGYRYDTDGYQIAQGYDDSDLFVLKSPYVTYAGFCSPCAPGACHLRNPFAADEPRDENHRCYCLGHDWFEDEVAPYPVYNAKTGALVPPSNAVAYHNTTVSAMERR